MSAAVKYEQRCPHGFLRSRVRCPEGCDHVNQRPELPDRYNGARVSDEQIVAALAQTGSLKGAARLLRVNDQTIRNRSAKSEAVTAALAQRNPSATRLVDLLGQTLGDWLVLSRAESRPNGNACWLCKHTCSEEGEERVLQGIDLRSKPPRKCWACKGKS